MKTTASASALSRLAQSLRPLLPGSAAAAPRLSRRVAQLAVAGSAALVLAGCSAFGSGKTELAPLAANAAQYAIQQSWSQDVGRLGDIELTPHVLGQAITVASENGSITSLDSSTGAVLWQTRLRDKLAAGVGSDGDTYAVVSIRNEVIAVRNGEEQWRYRLPARSYTSPFVAGGRVFILTADRTVTALDADNGALIWRTERDSEPLVLQKSGVLLAVRNTLVTGHLGRLSGLSPDSGMEYWEARLITPRGINDIERLVDLVGRYSRIGGDICVQAFQSAIGCINAERGVTRWSQRVNGSVGVDGNASTVFSVENNGRVQAWARNDGQNRWLSDSLQHRSLTAPLALERSVAIGDSTGMLHLLGLDDGKPVNRIQLHRSGLRVAPFLAGSRVIAIANNGTVYGLTPQ